MNTANKPEQPNQMSNERCILRLPDVLRRTGYKRTHIYHLMREGKFPKNVRIGARAVGWDSREIDQWVEAQLSSGTNRNGA